MQGLRETVAWYRENEWWWRPIKEDGPGFRAYYDAQYGSAASDRLPCLVLLWSPAPPASPAATSSITCWRKSRQLPRGRTARSGEPHAAADPRVSWSAVDLLDRGAVARALADLSPRSIYHCAGIAHVGESWSEPLRALSVNVARHASRARGVFARGPRLSRARDRFRAGLSPIAEPFSRGRSRSGRRIRTA